MASLSHRLLLVKRPASRFSATTASTSTASLRASSYPTVVLSSSGSRNDCSARVQCRGMATEKQIWNQIQSTKNIRKITASMKMVSAAKLKGDELRLAAARPFNKWTAAVGAADPTETTEGESEAVSSSKVNTGVPMLLESANYAEFPNKVLLVPFTSEKGLCGGVNSFISRGIKECLKQLHKHNKTAHVAVIGDKGRAQLRRAVGPLLIRSSTEIAAPATFALACALTTELLAVLNAAEAAAQPYDAVVLVYNQYVNPAVYTQMYKIITPFVVQTEVTESLVTYEFDSDKAELLDDMFEYMLASQVFHAFMDGATSEQSSRMTAMENASKNAGEMIHALTLKYNRIRQARITTELIEIISGASALDKK